MLSDEDDTPTLTLYLLPVLPVSYAFVCVNIKHRAFMHTHTTTAMI